MDKYDFAYSRIAMIVKIYIVAESSVCYDPVFVYLAACFYNEFSQEEDAYVFLAHVTKNLFPEDFFSAKQNFRGKFIQCQSFTKMAAHYCANLAKNLTTTVRLLDCINCAESEYDVRLFLI